MLVAAFGAEYERYRERTPRWVPRFSASRPSGRFRWSRAVRREAITIGLVAVLLFMLVERGARW